MQQTNELSIFGQNSIMTSQDSEAMKDFRLRCQTFVETINRLPPKESVDKTFDGKALTILISHIETTLDEFFFGLWDTVEFKWQVVTNEIIGSIQLEVIHPVTGHKIKRTGAAAIEIQVDAVPEEIKNNKKKRNEWALDPSNKKAGALDMGFPKLKAECIKNAANSLGKMFGRDLNRGGKADTFKGLIAKETVDLDNLAALFELKKDMMAAENIIHAERIINTKEKNSYTKLFKELQAL